MKIMALFLARAGSIQVPNKNILPLGGKPLIAYTIESAKKISCVTRTFVSTNSEEIFLVLRTFGADIPFLRPSEIAQGDSKIGLFRRIESVKLGDFS